jgi:hypothetical protein
MTHPVVSFSVWSDNKLVSSQSCLGDVSNSFQVPSLPSAEERHAILGAEPSNELLEQQKHIELLLNSLTDAGTKANTVLTDLMTQQVSSISKADNPEDYSSGEDAGDPNESMSTRAIFCSMKLCQLCKVHFFLLADVVFTVAQLGFRLHSLTLYTIHIGSINSSLGSSEGKTKKTLNFRLALSLTTPHGHCIRNRTLLFDTYAIYLGMNSGDTDP